MGKAGIKFIFTVLIIEIMLSFGCLIEIEKLAFPPSAVIQPGES